MISNYQMYRKQILISTIIGLAIFLIGIISFNYLYFNNQTKKVSNYNYQTESLMVKYANSKLTNQKVTKKVNLKKLKSIIVTPENKVSKGIHQQYPNETVITSFSKTGQQLIQKYNLYNTDFQQINLQNGKIKNLNLFTVSQLPNKKIRINQQLTQLKQMQQHLITLSHIRSFLVSIFVILTILSIVVIWLLYR